MTQPNFLPRNPSKKTVSGGAVVATVVLVAGIVAAVFLLQVWIVMVLAGAIHLSFNTDKVGLPWSFGQSALVVLVLDLVSGYFKRSSSS